jgi:hypothetical protein
MTAILLACAMVAQAKKEPDRVGRVIIEGNTATPDRLITGALLDLRPGQILQYPRLEASRKLLGCGLFDRANPPTVEVIGNELDATFKDIRVRVTERPDAWAYYAALDTVLGVVTLDVGELMDVGRRVRHKLNGKE